MTLFSVWAPDAGRVDVEVSGQAYPMSPIAGRPGWWTAEAAAPAGTDYAFRLDGGEPLADPRSPRQPYGPDGASRTYDHGAFAWTDALWRGAPLSGAVIYELHVGTFTPEGTFAAIIPRLAHLKSLGVTAIELMPVAQFPGDRNWGYDGVALYAVQNTYGSPHELKQLVDAAHAIGLGVVIDVVYNHVGPEGNYLSDYAPYFTDKYKTPWGAALNYDDTDSDDVRRFVVDNALFWITEYHADALRLDAVHGIFDFSATHLLQEIAESVHACAERLGRTALVIAESDLNDPKLVRGVEVNGYGLDAQWSDDFHHAVHATLTGEREGYYADFAGPVDIARALREPFVYDGGYSRCRRRKHGASSVGVPRKRFVVAIQNHDQVGNRAAGDRLSASLTPAQQRLAAALLLLSPYVPLIFMGQEYGETNPFQYFISHGDDELVAAVREGRRAEFASFGWGDDIPDPQLASTFERSRIEWAKSARAEYEPMLALYRDLLALRREEPMLRPDGAHISVTDGAPGWIALLRESVTHWGGDGGSSDALLALFNCTASPIDALIPDPDSRAWTLRISTDASGYAGEDEVATAIVATSGDEPRRLIGSVRRSVRLPAWTAALYTAVTNY